MRRAAAALKFKLENASTATEWAASKILNIEDFYVKLIASPLKGESNRDYVNYDYTTESLKLMLLQECFTQVQ